MRRMIAFAGTVLFFLRAAPALAEEVSIGIQRADVIKITSFPVFLGAVIGVILIIAFIVALFFLLWGGVQWITSGGDKGGVEAAQKKIQASLIGLVIVAAVWALFTVVGSWLGINIANLVLPDPTVNQ